MRFFISAIRGLMVISESVPDNGPPWMYPSCCSKILEGVFVVIRQITIFSDDVCTLSHNSGTTPSFLVEVSVHNTPDYSC